MGADGALESEIFAGVDLDAPRPFVLEAGTAVVYTHRSPESNRDNQDAVAIVSSCAGSDVLVVADGAGGAPAGDRAARAAVEAIVTAMIEVSKTGLPLREGVLRGFEAANRAILSMGIGAATTLAVVVISNDGLRAYHAGDSRILVCGQRSREKLLSTAHSPVGYAVEAGLLDEQDALRDDQLHLVSNVIGNPDMSVEVSSLLELARYDTVILGSDGLFDNLAPAEVTEHLRAGDLLAAVSKASSMAQRRMGRTDNRGPSKPDDLTIVAYRRG